VQDIGISTTTRSKGVRRGRDAAPQEEKFRHRENYPLRCRSPAPLHALADFISKAGEERYFDKNSCHQHQGHEHDHHHKGLFLFRAHPLVVLLLRQVVLGSMLVRFPPAPTWTSAPREWLTDPHAPFLARPSRAWL